MANYALILGSKSGIARAVAREFAQQGFNLYLAGRKAAEQIEPDVQDLKIRFGIEAKAIEYDAVDYDSYSYVGVGPAFSPVAIALGLFSLVFMLSVAAF